MATSVLAVSFPSRLQATYDRSVDVLYLVAGDLVESEGCGTEKGLQLDYYIESGRPYGATVVGYYHNDWNHDVGKLSQIIGEHLSLDACAVASVIRNALSG